MARRPRPSSPLRQALFLLRGARLEAESSRVNAVALAGGGGAVVEDMPLVCPARGAVDLRAAHEEAAVFLNLDVPLVYRLPEARPARPGVVLRLGAEERRPASHAGVDALALVVPVLACEGPLGALHPGYAVLLGGEPVLPFLFGSLYLPRRIGHTPILARAQSARCYISEPWGTRLLPVPHEGEPYGGERRLKGTLFLEDFEVGDVYEHP